MKTSQRIIMAVIMGFVMSLFMCTIMTIINVPLDKVGAWGFFWAWLQSLIISFVVTTPLSYILPPLIIKILVKNPPKDRQ